MSGELNIENHFPGEPDLPEAYLQHARLTIADITNDTGATRELIEILGLIPHRVIKAEAEVELPPDDAIPIEHIEQTTTVQVTVIRGEGWEIPCEGDNCTKPAEWILWRAQCCEMKSNPVFACTPCTTEQLACPPPVWCANCNHMFVSMTDVFPTIDPLEGSR